jgi:ribosomal protein S18 acetylase RimI-like enzyme
MFPGSESIKGEEVARDNGADSYPLERKLSSVLCISRFTSGSGTGSCTHSDASCVIASGTETAELMSQPIFERAQPEDVETLLPFIKAYYDFDGIPFDPLDVRRALGKLLDEPSLGRAWIIRDGVQAVGHVVLTFGYDLEFGGSVATVTEVYIVPTHRRLGIGKRLFDFLEDVCRDLGVAALELQVEQDNLEAQAFYSSVGFQAHQRISLSKRLRPDAK